MTLHDTRNTIKLFEHKVKTTLLLKWCGIARSSYYYHSHSAKRGRKPSMYTPMQEGDMISNESVVIAIRFILSEEFVCFGYRKITADLRQQGMIINAKKTYRLMKEHKLLCGVVIKAQGSKRRFVKWRVQQASRPMEQLCMDIKYVHIHGEKRNALLLTVLDVYTRSVVGQVLWWQMRKEHVIWLLDRILEGYQVKEVTIRNDNGSQFIAHAVREYLQEKRVVQEFIHVATPEENCFIEAYHSIIQRELLEPREFDCVKQAQEVFERWQQFYNHRRLHGSLSNRTPQYTWERYKEQQSKQELQPSESTGALSTNGERKSLQIGESRLVDKIVREQEFGIFEDQRDRSAQTVPENLSS